MAHRSRKYSIIIFLVAIFIVLAMSLGGTIFRYYQNLPAATANTQQIVDCGSFSYMVSDLEYSAGTLIFELENGYGSELQGIVVASGSTIRRINLTSFQQGDVTTIEITMPVSDTLKIYPPGCASSNFKQYTIG